MCLAWWESSYRGCAALLSKAVFSPSVSDPLVLVKLSSLRSHLPRCCAPWGEVSPRWAGFKGLLQHLQVWEEAGASGTLGKGESGKGTVVGGGGSASAQVGPRASLADCIEEGCLPAAAVLVS